MGIFRRPEKSTSGAGSAVFRSARVRQRKHLRHRWQWIALAVVLVLLALGGYGTYYYFHLQGAIQHETLGITKSEDPEKPFNVLLVGSDSRAGLTEQEQIDLGAATEDANGAIIGQRADTLIVAHIDPNTDKVTMVQFPRDMWVPVATGGRDKINSALEDGRGNLVQTVTELTGLPINHYIQVNIAGFRNMVDAINGVDVCIAEPIPFDPNTGIEVQADEVGMVHFNGDRALRFVRSRHAFAEGDFARIQNQQKFISAAIDKITSASTFFNPGRVNALANVARDNVVVDQHTTIKGLAEIGRKFQDFNPDDYEAYTAPNFGARDIDVDGTPVSIVAANFEAMKVLFGAIADNESPAQADGVPDIDPTTIRVGVYNGVGLDEPVAGPAADELAKATDTGAGGVDVVDIANAPRFNFSGTTIRYSSDEPEAEAMAELVVAAIPDATVEAGRTAAGVDVAVIVGKGRFRTEQITQLLPIPLPRPGDLPEVCRDDVASGG